MLIVNLICIICICLNALKLYNFYNEKNTSKHIPTGVGGTPFFSMETESSTTQTDPQVPLKNTLTPIILNYTDLKKKINF